MTTELTKIINKVKSFWKEFIIKLKHVSIESFGWTSTLALHSVTVPSLLGLMTGLTDYTPPIDMVLLLYAALTLAYIKAIFQKDMISMIIIGFGFIGQSAAMALIFFK